MARPQESAPQAQPESGRDHPSDPVRHLLPDSARDLPPDFLSDLLHEPLRSPPLEAQGESAHQLRHVAGDDKANQAVNHFADVALNLVLSDNLHDNLIDILCQAIGHLQHYTANHIEGHPGGRT